MRVDTQNMVKTTNPRDHYGGDADNMFVNKAGLDQTERSQLVHHDGARAVINMDNYDSSTGAEEKNVDIDQLSTRVFNRNSSKAQLKV